MTQSILLAHRSLLRGFRSALSILLAAALSLEAQTPLTAGTAYCIDDPHQACLRAAITTAPNTTGTSVEIRLSNLEGAAPVGTRPVAWERLFQLEILARDDGVFQGGEIQSPFVLSTSGSATENGDAAVRWSAATIGEPGLYKGYALFTNYTQGGAEIVGCTLPPSLTSPYYQTCGTGGNHPGDLVLRFSTAGSWSATQVGLVFALQDDVGETACGVNGTQWTNTDVPLCMIPGQSGSLTDTESPTIIVPAPVTVEATMPEGATVSFNPQATDNVGVTSLACIPLSGSIFSLGATTVVCTAKDAAGNTSSGTFTVTVVDTQAPNLTLPGNIVADATTPSGAFIPYVANAVDIVGVVGGIVCTPAGNQFSIGRTTVTCTAADAAGNAASGFFTVTVNGPSTQITNLHQSLAVLALEKGTRTSLDAKLSSALQSLSSNDLSSACGSLGDVISEANALTGKKIPPGDAQTLIAAVKRIRSAAGC